MDILLVSNRGAPHAEHWARPLAARAATCLSEEGHRVRWLAAVHEGEEPPSVSGVDLRLVPGRTPGFRKVQGRLTDPNVDIALTTWLREQSADIVHAVGFGAPGSVTTLWIAERMGPRCVATVRAADVLCHRGTLVDEAGTGNCGGWQDVERCLRCCMTPWERGLRPWQATCGRMLRLLGGLSPFPSRTEFLNRFELALGGLSCAQRVLAATEHDREQLVRSGISARAIAVGDLEELHGPGLSRIYHELME